MSGFITVSKLKEIEKHLENPDETLVIFDVDYVLTHPNEAAFQFSNFAYNMPFIRETFLNLTPLQRDIFANLMVFDSSGSSLVEKTAPKFIRQIQNQGYKTVALTASLTSELGSLSLKEERYKKLKEQSIDFSSSFQNCEELTFKQLQPNRGTYPSFYKGILFSNGENQVNQKAPALKTFLKTTQTQVKRILMVDDRAPNLEAIQEMFTSDSLDVKGFLYKGSFIYPSKRVDQSIFEEKWTKLARKAVLLSKESNKVSF